MKPVETYVEVTSKDIQKVLESHEYLKFQGSNLLFIQGAYSQENVLNFLTIVFNVIGKIALRDKEGKMFIVCDRFTEDVTEPFSSYEDVTKIFANNLEKMSEFIAFGNKTYEV
jgi:hypothetical protein